MWEKIERVIYVVLQSILQIFGKSLSKSTFDVCMQFLKFGVVGVSNTLISYVIYMIVLLLLQQSEILVGVDFLVAQVVAFILSVLWSFYWNNRVVFKADKEQNRSWKKALLKTYVSYSFTGLFLNSILLVLWVQFCGISEFYAPLINLLISVPVNFIINKFWAFK